MMALRLQTPLATMDPPATSQLRALQWEGCRSLAATLTLTWVSTALWQIPVVSISSIDKIVYKMKLKLTLCWRTAYISFAGWRRREGMRKRRAEDKMERGERGSAYDAE